MATVDSKIHTVSTAPVTPRELREYHLRELLKDYQSRVDLAAAQLKSSKVGTLAHSAASKKVTFYRGCVLSVQDMLDASH